MKLLPILLLSFFSTARAGEIVSGAFDETEMKIHLKVKEATTGNRHYGLAGGCFLNIRPTQCVFTANPEVLSILTAPETNDVVIGLNDLRRSGRNRLGSLGSTFLEPAVADQVPGSKVEPKASLRNLFGGESQVIIRIVGDNNSEFSFVLPSGFGKPTD